VKFFHSHADFIRRGSRRPDASFSTPWLVDGKFRKTKDGNGNRVTFRASARFARKIGSEACCVGRRSERGAQGSSIRVRALNPGFVGRNDAVPGVLAEPQPEGRPHDPAANRGILLEVEQV